MSGFLREIELDNRRGFKYWTVKSSGRKEVVYLAIFGEQSMYGDALISGIGQILLSSLLVRGLLVSEIVHYPGHVIRQSQRADWCIEVVCEQVGRHWLPYFTLLLYHFPRGHNLNEHLIAATCTMQRYTSYRIAENWTERRAISPSNPSK